MPSLVDPLVDQQAPSPLRHQQATWVAPAARGHSVLVHQRQAQPHSGGAPRQVRTLTRNPNHLNLTAHQQHAHIYPHVCKHGLLIHLTDKFSSNLLLQGHLKNASWPIRPLHMATVLHCKATEDPLPYPPAPYHTMRKPAFRMQMPMPTSCIPTPPLASSYSLLPPTLSPPPPRIPQPMPTTLSMRSRSFHGAPEPRHFCPPAPS